MKPVLIILTLSLLVALSGCIQPQSGPQVKEAVASEAWKPDGIVGANEYARSMHLHGLASSGYSGGDLEISWKNDAQFLYLALNGSTKGWIALGFEPAVWMKDADIIMGSEENGVATVLDQNCTGNYGPHLNDTELGGAYDILEFGGQEHGNWTAIELKRKMNTGDEFDKVLAPGQNVSIIWAMADETSENVKHNMAKGEGTLYLQ
ncbi:DOMON domain protein [uncultured archaeon]|nr:DOMON domain protein [uncultured archaeon]